MKEELQIVHETLKKNHPSYSWFTPAEKTDSGFLAISNAIKDSLNVQQFRMLLSKAIEPIKCGHTVARALPPLPPYIKLKHDYIFPLYLKAWNKDSAVVLANAFTRDSVLTRGTIIYSINQRTINNYLDSMFQFISTDAYNQTHKYQLVSNNFPLWYKNTYGSKSDTTFKITGRYNNGHYFDTTITGYDIVYQDSILKAKRQADTLSPKPKLPKLTREQKKLQFRSLKIDTALNLAVLDIKTFSKSGTKKFFRKSFRAIKEQGIKNLVVELRSNGGGRLDNSTNLVRYLKKDSYRLADSIYTLGFNFPYPEYVKGRFWLKLEYLFLGKKDQNGNKHIKYYERTHHQPFRKNHFDGNIYIITGGSTFSASVLFTKALLGQHNVLVVGEETGGGSYGNTAIHMPDIQLPYSKIKVRLPLFRMVLNKEENFTPRGIFPDVEIPPTAEFIRNNIDPKMQYIEKRISKS
ncbi:S41 family peptidase [Polluticaenibacter yanchengensis]|uniref:S41 family peptidase n=1 Tax=Polluticaenibacter yanchengensis TaxID=3014562 RepID=A0ABT4UPA5_9BACT|nr:S41 family peptidase [Chitinophagaceae bacterium LY-5]